MAAIPSTREAQGSPLLQHTQSSHPGSVNRVLARKIPESAPKHPLCELKELFEKKAPPATKENLFKAIERLERIFPGIIKDVTKEYEKSNELVAGISSSESVSQLKNCFETVVRKNIENRDDARTIYLTVASHLQSRGFERDKIVDGKKRLFENYEHLANVLSTPINVTSVGRSLNPLDTIQNNITSEDKEGIINCLKEIDAQIPDFRNSVLAAYYQKFTEHPGDMGNWGEDHVHEYPDQLREVINNHIRSLRDNLGKDQELFGDKLQSGSLDNWGEFFVAYVATQEELQEASRTEHSPIGLQNISANCWINSVLQLFLNTELSAFLEGSPKEGVQQFKARYERDKTTKQKISQANSQEIRELLATPAGISNNPNIHEDAHEGFMLLLPENADHRLSFTTQTTRTYQNNQSVSADPEARFALHLDLHPEHLNFTDALSLTMNRKTSDPTETGIVEGNRLKLKQESTSFVGGLPDHLPLLVNRFSAGLTKKSEKLFIPGEIVLKQGEEYGKYALKGFIEHQGQTLHRGHYVTYVKEGENWVLYNDDTVAPVTEAEALKAAENAYIPYFVKKDERVSAEDFTTWQTQNTQEFSAWEKTHKQEQYDRKKQFGKTINPYTNPHRADDQPCKVS